MSDLMVWWYQRLVDFLIWISELSTKLFPNNDIVTGIFLAITILLVIGVFTNILKQNEGKWPHWIYMVTGALPLWIVLYASIVRLEGNDLFKQSGFYSSIPVLMILFLMLIFLAAVLFMDMPSGLQIVKVWLGEFLFCCVLVQLWKSIAGSKTFSLSIVLPIPELGNLLQKFLESTGLGIQAFWLLSVPLFIIFGMVAVYMLFYVMHKPSKECTIAIYAQVAIAAVYLLYGCLDKKIGVPTYATLGLLVLYIAGVLYYCTVFLGRIFLKDKQGCIRVLFIGIAGLCMDEAILLAISFVKAGGAKGIVQGGLWIANALYTKTPFSRYPQDDQSMFVTLCRLILAVAILCLLQYVFYRLARKLIEGILDKTLSYTWAKSTARLAVLPIIIQWMLSTFSQVFAALPKESIQYIENVLHTSALLGLGICLVNIIQMVVIRKWKQISAIIAVLSISFATLLFVPFLISLI